MRLGQAVARDGFAVDAEIGVFAVIVGFAELRGEGDSQVFVTTAQRYPVAATPRQQPAEARAEDARRANDKNMQPSAGIAYVRSEQRCPRACPPETD